MAGLIELEDDQGQALGQLLIGHDAYQLPDGSRHSVPTSPGWCRQCRAFVNIEQLEDVRESTVRLAMSERTSPPRCLECGGTDHAAIPLNFTWVEHPAESGRRVRVKPGFAHVQMRKGGRLYDTEGVLLLDPDAPR